MRKFPLTLAVLSTLAGCDRNQPTNTLSPETTQSLQTDANDLVEPYRYLQLSDLARAIRKRGESCQAVQTYKLIKQGPGTDAVYKVDCLEYSFRLTLSKGQNRVERWTGDAIAE